MRQHLRLALVLAVLSAPALGATIYVPDDHAAIQGAIVASGNGDTIIVRPGTYVENIDFLGKGITVLSERGPAVTVIDGNRAGSVVNFPNVTDEFSVLEGFHITNGLSQGGGGIDSFDSSPTIRGNWITDNVSLGEGGGIYSYGPCSSPTVIGNIFSNNRAVRGGAISVNGGWPKVLNNFVLENTASSEGGGFYCYDSCNGPVVTGNTFCGNTAAAGGGIFATHNAIMNITNTILWNDSAPVAPEIWLGSAMAPSTLSISHSDVAGGPAAVHVEAGSTLVWGAGMIDADPLFADPARGDFHLTWNSPCRDAGDSGAPLIPAVDFEGDPRVAGGSAEIGADEFYPHLYHVSDVIPGASIDVKVAAEPGAAPVTLALGTGVLDPPLPTPFGDLHLVLPPSQTFDLGAIPSSGILAVPAKVPAAWQAGEEYPFQALIGPRSGPGSILTNLLTMQVQ
jgi:parallel beta-helix repeat protein